jgi:hypothetical protein
MLSNDNHNSSCGFAEQIVSYLYDEASDGEKLEFETHLKNCPGCADELSAFGFVRSSISDWRLEEISALAMPALEIPMRHPVDARRNAAPAPASGSWTANLKRLFSLSPKLAFGSLALVAGIVGAGLILVILNFSSKDDLTETGSQNTERILASNTNQTSRPEKIVPLKEDRQDAAAPPKSEEADNKPAEKLNSERKQTLVKAAAKNKSAAPKSYNTVAASSGTGKNKSVKTKTQEIPKLSDFDDDEDDSLRLADLFGEFDTE